MRRHALAGKSTILSGTIAEYQYDLVHLLTHVCELAGETVIKDVATNGIDGLPLRSLYLYHSLRGKSITKPANN
jgi:hypothetical protein